MSAITITITGDKAIGARLGRGLGGAARAMTWGIGELVRNAIARYPGPVHHPIRWTSMRQRFYYRRMRAERGLPMKYTRQSDPMSQRLGPSWTVARRGDNTVVGTRVGYAPWVQSAKLQQGFHKNTGWITDKEAAERVSRSGDIARIAEQAIRKELGI